MKVKVIDLAPVGCMEEETFRKRLIEEVEKAAGDEAKSASSVLSDGLADLIRLLICKRNEILDTLGTDFEEKIYQSALEVELTNTNPPGQISFQREVYIPVMYRGTPVGHSMPDFIVRSYKNNNEPLILELKARNSAMKHNSREVKQLITYVRSIPFTYDRVLSRCRVGLLLNFAKDKEAFLVIRI